jgi:hypothetical protein
VQAIRLSLLPEISYGTLGRGVLLRRRAGHKAISYTAEYPQRGAYSQGHPLTVRLWAEVALRHALSCGQRGPRGALLRPQDAAKSQGETLPENPTVQREPNEKPPGRAPKRIDAHSEHQFAKPTARLNGNQFRVNLREAPAAHRSPPRTRQIGGLNLRDFGF